MILLARLLVTHVHYLLLGNKVGIYLKACCLSVIYRQNVSQLFSRECKPNFPLDFANCATY